MKLKVTFQDGDKTRVVSFAGDPGEAVGAAVQLVTDTVGGLQKWLAENVPVDS